MCTSNKPMMAFFKYSFKNENSLKAYSHSTEKCSKSHLGTIYSKLGAIILYPFLRLVCNAIKMLNLILYCSDVVCG